MAPAQEGGSLGEYLCALRSNARASLTDMAVATRVSERYLRALESGVRDELPAPVFVKGFIRAYCAFLGVPADEALARYDHERGAPATGQSRAMRVRPRRGWMGHPLAISSALLLIFGGGLVALKLTTRPTPTRFGEPGATVPAPVSTQAMAAAPARSMPPVSDAPASGGAGARERQHLVVKAVERTWIRVQMDDGRVEDLLLEAGAQREWTSDGRFLLTISNAGGIEIMLNGRPLPSLGARGAVIRRLSLPELPGQGS